MAELEQDDEVLLAIIGGPEPGDDLVVDCLISDNHNFDAEVTEFPTESGGTISDNIRNKPLVVTMECIVTNSPIGQAVNFRQPGSVPSDTAYAALLKIRAAKKPVTIRTSLSTYRNMALQNVTIPRESGRGDEIRFTATFKQIETVVNHREKRVAIVGAQGGGTIRTVAPAANIDNSQDSIYIYTLDNTWYDVAIAGWRTGVLFPEAKNVKSGSGATSFTPAQPGVTELLEGPPIDLGDKAWLRLPDSGKKAIRVRPLVIAKQGGKPRNVLYKKVLRSVLQLFRGQFIINRAF